jgi:hypothetical protein
LAFDFTFPRKAQMQDPRDLLPGVGALEPETGAKDQNLGLAGGERGQTSLEAREEPAKRAL